MPCCCVRVLNFEEGDAPLPLITLCCVRVVLVEVDDVRVDAIGRIACVGGVTLALALVVEVEGGGGVLSATATSELNFNFDYFLLHVATLWYTDQEPTVAPQNTRASLTLT